MKQQKTNVVDGKTNQGEVIGLDWELSIPANDNLQVMDVDCDALIAENDNEADFDLSETGIVFSENMRAEESQVFADPYYSEDMPKELDFTDAFSQRGFLSE